MLCDNKTARFKIQRSQWKAGADGAQYVCLDVPKPTFPDENTDAMRLVLLNLGNLPCDDTVDAAMSTPLSFFSALMLLLWHSLQ